jgi:hypothetical protein
MSTLIPKSWSDRWRAHMPAVARASIPLIGPARSWHGRLLSPYLISVVSSTPRPTGWLTQPLGSKPEDSGESLSGCRGGRGSKWQNRCVPWRRAWRETLGGSRRRVPSSRKEFFHPGCRLPRFGRSFLSSKGGWTGALPSIGSRPYLYDPLAPWSSPPFVCPDLDIAKSFICNIPAFIERTTIPDF